jgi:5-methylcytosine-specific restriction endonuclease McrA
MKSYKHTDNIVNKNCVWCRDIFPVRREYAGRRSYCSKRCRRVSRERRIGIRPLPPRTIKHCLACEGVMSLKPSQAKRLECCSNKCRGVVKSARFKTTTSKSDKVYIRGTEEYKRWRLSVFQRDDYTCVFCGLRGVRIQADHILPYAAYPQHRLTLSNGRTLCVPCHKSTSTFGGKLLRRCLVSGRFLPA